MPRALLVTFHVQSRSVAPRGRGIGSEVKRAFAERPHLVDTAVGFIRLDVISPTDNLNEIWLLTYWPNEDSFRTDSLPRCQVS